MGLSNDERGWIMTSLSGVACVLGASVICVDIIIRQFPGKKDFKIQDSDAFLSSSLSLSFGVMLFSSLYSMLPSSKKSLIESGYDPKTATWIMIACFLGGFVGIQVISRILHKFIPSHVVDCEHTHGDEETSPKETHSHSHFPTPTPKRPHRPRSRTKSSLPGHLHQPDPPSPKVGRTSYFNSNNIAGDFAPTAESIAALDGDVRPATAPARPSFAKRLTSKLTRLTTTDKEQCDSTGPCHGFSDLCGSDCFKNVSNAGGAKAANGSTRASLRQTKSIHLPISESTPLLHDIDENATIRPEHQHNDSHEHDNHLNHDHHDAHEHENDEQHESHHHHHVPTNAFLSIGLQTSIAIALHKLPEGFITYATNHANPQLGFAVFLALFIHNITEGFAMALPLYLAINSRVKAMLWSFVLGGLSQPLGAGVAALWFTVAGNGSWAPSEGVYGGMFAATAGIMVSVALQLFSESLDLSHNRTLCMIGAITGMCILGISSALTAT